jgi:hypothetical protein
MSTGRLFDIFGEVRGEESWKGREEGKEGKKIEMR